MAKHLTTSFSEAVEVRDEDGKGFGLRHVQALLIFACFFTTFFLRINLSVGIVSMTDKNSSNPEFDEFDWSEREKSTVLSSFFWGYLVVQAPVGQLGQHWSPKNLLFYSNLVSALLGCLTPAAAYTGGWQLLSLVRACQGLCQGFLVPLSYNLASKWSPPNERNRFVGFSLNGGTLGATVALPLSGLLASSRGGWPSIFYCSGLLGLIWCLLWLWLGADTPELHKNISPAEKQFIQNSLKFTSQSKTLKTPWKEIFTSIPFWALIAAHLGNGWAFSILFTEIPSYINSVLQFNIEANGFLSALPYLCMWILTFPCCWLADFLQQRNIISNNVARKLWTTISQTGGALLYVGMGFAGKNQMTAIILLTIGLSLSAFIFSGFNINHLDLAPNFAGVLMGLGNGLENVTAIIAPLTVGWIVTDSSSVEQWRVVFLMAAAVSIIGNIFFVIFGSTKVQPWNSPPDKKQESTQI